jgi:hypothetical protein
MSAAETASPVQQTPAPIPSRCRNRGLPEGGSPVLQRGPLYLLAVQRLRKDAVTRRIGLKVCHLATPKTHHVAGSFHLAQRSMAYLPGLSPGLLGTCPSQLGRQAHSPIPGRGPLVCELWLQDSMHYRNRPEPTVRRDSNVTVSLAQDILVLSGLSVKKLNSCCGSTGYTHLSRP